MDEKEDDDWWWRQEKTKRLIIMFISEINWQNFCFFFYLFFSELYLNFISRQKNTRFITRNYRTNLCHYEIELSIMSINLNAFSKNWLHIPMRTNYTMKLHACSTRQTIALLSKLYWLDFASKTLSKFIPN